MQHAELWTRLREGAFDDLAAAEEEADRAECLERVGLLEGADRALTRARRHQRAAAARLVPPSVTLADIDDGIVEIPPITRAFIAGWLYGIPSAIGPDELDRALGPGERERVDAAWRAVARHYHAQLDSTDSTLALTKRKAALTQAQQDHDFLRALLRDGLDQRLGRQLAGGEEWVYAHLVARGIKVDGIRVCERCLVVFAARRAHRCLSCRRSPDRPQPKAWHTQVHFPDPAPSSPATTVMVVPSTTGASLVIASTRRRAPAKLTYSGRCAICSATFNATDARQRHCPACATRAARTRRCRAQRARNRGPGDA